MFKPKTPKEPYRYLHFPAVMYRGATEHKRVEDQAQEDAAIAAGFTRTAPLPVGSTVTAAVPEAPDDTKTDPNDDPPPPVAPVKATSKK